MPFLTDDLASKLPIHQELSSRSFNNSRGSFFALSLDLVNFKLRLVCPDLHAGRKLLFTHIDFFRIKIHWFSVGLDVRGVHSWRPDESRFASGLANVLPSRQVLRSTRTMRSRWLPALDCLSRQRCFVI